MTTDPTDAELIARSNTGDVQALEALYIRHRDWVHGVALRFCERPDDAQDVVQDVFIYFFGRFPGFKLTAQLRTYLYPLVRSKAVDRIRKNKRIVLVDDPAKAEEAPPLRDEVAERRALAERVAGLEEAQRELVILRFVDGFSLQEIADRLGLALGTVKSRLHYALAALRDVLEDDAP